MENYGVTDLPLENTADLLNHSKYIKGLVKFITNCPTPMSISVQGEWGTGKTSIIHAVESAFKSQGYTTLYFNTWQYSQFNMKESLYYSFITCLIKKITPENKDVVSFLINMSKIMIPMINKVNIISEHIDLDKIQEIAREQVDVAEKIEALKNDFSSAVKKHLGQSSNMNRKKDRIIIFIDDLDRLDPAVAVELLEVIKLFLDVSQCIFVLAIDYDIVVEGVKQKLGENTSIDKCRAFFEKIIQLPFMMPVESYDLTPMARKYLKNYIEEDDLEVIATFARVSVGANPRNFKRVFNSFVLTDDIDRASDNREKSEEKYRNALLFCSLCIQQSIPEVYSYLRNNPGWYDDDENGAFYDNELKYLKTRDELIKQMIHVGIERSSEDTYWTRVNQIFDTLGTTMSSLSFAKKNGCSQCLINLKEAMDLTAFTGIIGAEEKEGRSSATKVDRIVVLGQEVPTTKLSSATVKTFEIILNRYREKLDECKEQLLILDSESAKENSVFRSKAKIMVDDREIWIGISTSFEDKCKYMNRLASICNLNKDSIVWFWESQVIYSNKG